ncbi:MAG: hypothetical protein ACD_79C01458G0004 [uncultured bacterium]|nr:MAG: hypothetical protein ACD_79C01458G0004 [uncultured bacterium]
MEPLYSSGNLDITNIPAGFINTQKTILPKANELELVRKSAETNKDIKEQFVPPKEKVYNFDPQSDVLDISQQAFLLSSMKTFNESFQTENKNQSENKNSNNTFLKTNNFDANFIFNKSMEIQKAKETKNSTYNSFGKINTQNKL